MIFDITTFLAISLAFAAVQGAALPDSSSYRLTKRGKDFNRFGSCKIPEVVKQPPYPTPQNFEMWTGKGSAKNLKTLRGQNIAKAMDAIPRWWIASLDTDEPNKGLTL